ncbi:hypothetical protein LDFHOB_03340 [Candidatus Electronema aureum]
MSSLKRDAGSSQYLPSVLQTGSFFLAPFLSHVLLLRLYGTLIRIGLDPPRLNTTDILPLSHIDLASRISSSIRLPNSVNN